MCLWTSLKQRVPKQDPNNAAVLVNWGFGSPPTATGTFRLPFAVCTALLDEDLHRGFVWLQVNVGMHWQVSEILPEWPSSAVGNHISTSLISQILGNHSVLSDGKFHSSIL